MYYTLFDIYVVENDILLPTAAPINHIIGLGTEEERSDLNIYIIISFGAVHRWDPQMWTICSG